MDINIADRYQISHDLVRFSRQSFEAELSEQQDMSFKTTEDLWTDILARLDMEREGKRYNLQNYFIKEPLYHYCIPYKCFFMIFKKKLIGFTL